jgi:hypothetical protein
MIGFHIDMNIGHYPADYLRKWLVRLAELGYDTILWEVEAAVQWETAGECSSPEAFTADEFKGILNYCRELALEPIPLLQTLGHCEYVLKHSPYKYLAEKEGDIRQYCPQNPQVAPLLTAWIDEYLALFGDIEEFHLGADEAFLLGSCDRCKSYAENHSLSDLFVDHIKKLCRHVAAQGVAPVLWADMLIQYPEHLSELPDSTTLFDWAYDNFHGSDELWIHGMDLQKGTFYEKPEFPAYFRPHVFSKDDKGNERLDPFFPADYLAEQGFAVVTCPASSCYRDNVFCPRTEYHLRNTFDSFRKGLSDNLAGSLLTSWSVHLFPWELQLPCIEAAVFARANPDSSVEAFQKHYTRNHFGTDSPDFFNGVERLAKSCLFSTSNGLGYNKSAQPVEPGYFRNALESLATEGRLAAELADCRQRLQEYREGHQILDRFSRDVARGREELDGWLLAGRNMINRAEASICLLTDQLKRQGTDPLPDESPDCQRVLGDLQHLKTETDKLYQPIIKTSRRAEYITWMFEGVEKELAQTIDAE